MTDKIDKLLAEAESKQIQDLKKDNLRLLKQLDKAKNRKEDMISAVYDAVNINLKLWDKPKIPKPKNIKKSKDEEIKRNALRYLNVFKKTPYIFNLGHGLLPETDPNKLDRLIKFYRDYK